MTPHELEALVITHADDLARFADELRPVAVNPDLSASNRLRRCKTLRRLYRRADHRLWAVLQELNAAYERANALYEENDTLRRQKQYLADALVRESQNGSLLRKRLRDAYRMLDEVTRQPLMKSVVYLAKKCVGWTN